jgi:hypothetical protein
VSEPAHDAGGSVMAAGVAARGQVQPPGQPVEDAATGSFFSPIAAKADNMAIRIEAATQDSGKCARRGARPRLPFIIAAWTPQ